MFKILTAVLFLSTICSSSHVQAGEEGLFPGQLSTKGLVRMSLWYEGLDRSESSENQGVRAVEISEELERALIEVK
jgi:hypothetical protein